MSILSAARGISTTIFSNLFVSLPIPSADSDLSVQTFIVTGSNKGLGLESARHLSRLGAGKLILAVRNEAKGLEAKRNILATTARPESSIDIWSLDMDSVDSIRAFAVRAATLPRIDGVLANAGLMTTKFSSSEGNEQSLHVNVIGTFLLYLLLAPKMRESGRHTGNVCRYAIPNSALHYTAPITELRSRDDGLMRRLSNRDTADMAGRYSLTKLLVVYAVRELAERSAASAKEAPIIINTPNPSFCKSDLGKEMADSLGFKISERLIARSTEEGSRTLVHGLLAGQETNGQYLTNCHVARYSTVTVAPTI
ncbi:hypothetical protein NQ176_g3569 [Zarea fungicola]|uniref:Uncharacterized protein n=1 Tax=Zarea fungicola TaxID=93591 RepID=A0ACC1NJ39_9HYPO|nr:hypothetical protein NQ176_g3569 [Lecanicillium fungicola]